MTALVRYQAALLARSQRWLAPVLLYAAFVGTGVTWGQPVLGSLGYAAAGLLPVTAWLVRLCATQEPPAARTVTAAAVGSPRAHLASLLAGLGCAGLLGVLVVPAVLLVSRPAGADGTVRVGLLPAGAAGLVATACCVLVGAAIGALCTWPLLRRRGWSLAGTVFLALPALVAGGSPANTAVRSLVTGERTGAVQPPLAALAVAAVLAVAVAALACRRAAAA
ncbi:ABC transporter [Streptomyces sp. NPDC057499]|uniref:ABC transporter n=1 Tax=Streptomyces sp. NPDC057499 TaxID=3346150 RepID=UPI00369A3EC5